MRKTLAIALALVLMGALTAIADPTQPGGSYLDDDGNVHEGAIEAIALEGITRGCNPPANDLFCPDDSVTRGQMAAFLRRAFSLPAASTDWFTDDGDSEFEPDIDALAESGITRGCNPPDNDLFCPDDTVSRGQMAAFLRRAFGYEASNDDWFGDDSDSVFQADINALAAAGVTAGCNPPANSEYCPLDDVERGQMASFLTRALDLDPITPPSRPTTTTSSSTTTTTGGQPGNPGDSKNCDDFDTWAEAQAWYETYFPHYGDVARLDRDGNGIACESLPGAP